MLFLGGAGIGFRVPIGEVGRSLQYMQRESAVQGVTSSKESEHHMDVRPCMLIFLGARQDNVSGWRCWQRGGS